MSGEPSAGTARLRLLAAVAAVMVGAAAWVIVIVLLRDII
jgi:hypothetical protein